MELKGKGITAKSVEFSSSFFDDEEDDIGISFLRIVAPLFQYFNILNYSYTSSIVFRYRFYGNEDNKPQIRIYEKS